MVDEELKSNAAALEASHCCLLRARIGRQRRKAPQRRAFPQQLVQQESQNCSHRETATSKNRNIEEPQHRRTATLGAALARRGSGVTLHQIWKPRQIRAAFVFASRALISSNSTRD
jgi:hypothetical protein